MLLDTREMPNGNPEKDVDFHSGEVQAQDRWGTVDIWDEGRRQQLLWKAIPQEFHSRIENAPFFFLSTSGSDGSCDCSFKGGGPGLIRMLAVDQLAFPDFEGNGAFMSLGNIMENPQVGILLIDFTDGTRLRVNGRAEILEGNTAKEIFPNAERAILVNIELAVPNCSQHVPRLVPASTTSAKINEVPPL